MKIHFTTNIPHTSQISRLYQPLKIGDWQPGEASTSPQQQGFEAISEILKRIAPNEKGGAR